jgi:aryl-alcohol dehydrogenase-like predicted oxidoreductase
MEQRNLGSSGLQVSVVGVGCNNFGGRIDFDATKAVVHKALEVGITLFDTADVYGGKGGSETFLGEILGDERKNIVLATKFGLQMDDTGHLNGASRKYIVQAVEASLKRLQTDYIDLYQLHRPDPKTPIEETLRAMNDLVRHGMVRYIGCSNLPAWQVADAQWTAKSLGLEGFASCQDEYSLLMRDPEKELLPAMMRFGMGLLPYFPLASGLLTGKYRRDAPNPEGARLSYMQGLADQYMTDTNWRIIDGLKAFCDAREHSMLELAFSWLAINPRVSSVIAGATRPEQVEQNAQAVSWKLSTEDLSEIDRIIKDASSPQA